MPIKAPDLQLDPRTTAQLARMKITARACAHCGRPMLATRSDARYCSNACRQAAYRIRRAALPIDFV